MSSLYIHIPFCQSKCGYCSFSSWPGLETIHDRYIQAVLKELSEAAKTYDGGQLSTIFFGGGTPTVLPASQLQKILNCCGQLFGMEKGAEITLEANPGTIDREKLGELKAAGFSRISIGVQSFRDEDLQVLGRCHTASEAVAAFRDARAAGFDNISLDLMYGLPKQSVESWRQNLAKVMALGPEHISMYQLTVEEDTPFFVLEGKGMLELPADEAIIAMDDLNLHICRAEGYDWYEVSNFARPGYRCRHNLNYWHNEQYLAAGAGAVSYLAGQRERRVADPAEYVAMVESDRKPIVESEKLSRDESFRETVTMGLRLTEGIEIKRLRTRYGVDTVAYYGDTLQKLLADGLMECSHTHLRVSEKGRLFSNVILAELV